MTAADRLHLTGERLLRLRRVLCRIPGAPAGPEPFAALFEDPAARLSSLVESVLQRGPAAVGEDARPDGAGGGDVVGPWPAAARPLPAPVATATYSHGPPPTTVPAARPHRALAGDAGGGPQPAVPQPAGPPPGRGVRLFSSALPVVTSRASGDAPDGAVSRSAPGTGGAPPDDRAPRPARPPRPAATESPPAAGPVGGRATDGTPVPAQYATPETPTVPAGALRAVRVGSTASVRPPLEPAVAGPLGGTRLAQGGAELAAALRTNLARPSPAPGNGSPGRAEPAAWSAGAPQAETVPDAAPRVSPAGGEDRGAVNGGAEDGGAEAGPDIHDLMERFAAELADEFVRAYGTSGR